MRDKVAYSRVVLSVLVGLKVTCTTPSSLSITLEDGFEGMDAQLR